MKGSHSPTATSDVKVPDNKYLQEQNRTRLPERSIIFLWRSQQGQHGDSMKLLENSWRPHRLLRSKQMSEMSVLWGSFFWGQCQVQEPEACSSSDASVTPKERSVGLCSELDQETRSIYNLDGSSEQLNPTASQNDFPWRTEVDGEIAQVEEAAGVGKGGASCWSWLCCSLQPRSWNHTLEAR